MADPHPIPAARTLRMDGGRAFTVGVLRRLIADLPDGYQFATMTGRGIVRLIVQEDVRVVTFALDAPHQRGYDRARYARRHGD